MITPRWLGLPYRTLVLVGIGSSLAGASAAWILSDHDSGDVTNSVAADAPRVAGTADSGLRVLDASKEVSFPGQLANLPTWPSHLYVGADGVLWFPLLDDSDYLYRYDPDLQTLEKFSLPSDVGTALFSGLAVSRDGHIFVGNGYTVASFDIRTKALETFTLVQPPTNFAQQTHEGGTWITDIAAAEDGRVYIGRMNNAALTVLDPATGAVTDIPIPTSFGPIMKLQPAPDGVYLSNLYGAPGIPRQMALLSPAGTFTSLEGTANSFAPAANGEVYAAEVGGGLSLLHGADKSRVQDPGIMDNLSGGADYLVEGADGQLWVAGRGNGTIARYDPRAGGIQIYQLPVFGIPAWLLGCPPELTCSDVSAPTIVEGIAAGPSGELYFADSTNNRIGVIKLN